MAAGSHQSDLTGTTDDLGCEGNSRKKMAVVSHLFSFSPTARA